MVPGLIGVVTREDPGAGICAIPPGFGGPFQLLGRELML